MKLISGIFLLILAILISGVAAYFSIVGLAALFAATFIPVVVMGATLEAGKLAAAQWLKTNWSNPSVNWLHKTYLFLAIVVLMVVTALGIYGFLSKGHLEQEAPMAGVSLQIAQKEQQISTLNQQNDRLVERIDQLDASYTVLLKNNAATKAIADRNKQKIERTGLEKQIDENHAKIQTINAEILPLKMKNGEVEAKLGPVKYVAELLGLDDSGAVRLMIILIMVAFDPLAIALLLASTITLSDYAKERALRRTKQEELDKPATTPEPDTVPQPVVAPQPEPEPIVTPTSEQVDFMNLVLQNEQVPSEVKADIAPVVAPKKARKPRVPKAQVSQNARLIEILETHPDLLKGVIDAVNEANDPQKPSTSEVTPVAEEDINQQQSPTTDASKERLEKKATSRDNSWLAKPKPAK